MSFFLLMRERAATSIPTDLAARFSAAGLHRIHDIRSDGWRLWMFCTLNAATIPLIRTPDGDLATATGWFSYDGATGTEALRGCLTDFDGTSFAWPLCRGHFTLVMRKAGRWHLLGDGMQACKIHYNAEQTWFSNSFLAILAGIRHPEPDPQGCWEYAVNGTTFGEQSFVRQVRSTPLGSMTILAGTVTHHPLPDPLPWQPEETPASCEEAARMHLERLRALFRLYARHFGARLRTAISGGYDSRLILALLLDAGARPELFTYGTPRGDPEVAVAREVAAAAGLPLEVIDKTRVACLPPDRCKEHVERNCMAFDGWKPAGLFDSGVDLDDRLARSRDRILLNGSVGEIYRNFYYLPDRPLPLRAVVWSFYSRYRPAEFTTRFSATAYADALTASLRHALGAPSTDRPLPRGWTERSYPLFRGRYWSARDLNINLRFGIALYPFLETAIVRDTWHLPLSCKQHGWLEARMIQLASPELAGCRSIYGHPFTQPPSWRRRLATQATLLRPIALRGYAYRLQYRHPHPLPDHLTPEWLGRVLDLSFPFMRPLFQVEQIHNPEVFNRVATMEYLFQNVGG